MTRGRLHGGWLVLAAALAPAAAKATSTSTAPADPPPAAPAAPADAGASTPDVLVDHREVIMPIPGGERVRIENPLGQVVVRGWSRPGEIHIVADKSAPVAEQIHRLRVHYMAWANGEISVDTRVDLAGRERSLPLSGSRVDLIVEVPPDIEIEAKTFGGDLKVSGVNAGARLETTGGRIDVHDVRGSVVTHQLRGGQQVVAVEGDVDLDGVEGRMDLQGVGGGRLDARLVDGTIRAADVRSDAVRLVTTTGDIVFIGLLRPAVRYEMHTYEGDVILAPRGPAVAFDVRARAPKSVASALPWRVIGREGGEVRAVVDTRGGSAAGGVRGHLAEARPLVELSSGLGRVLIEGARAEVDVAAP